MFNLHNANIPTILKIELLTIIIILAEGKTVNLQAVENTYIVNMIACAGNRLLVYIKSTLTPVN